MVSVTASLRFSKAKFQGCVDIISQALSYPEIAYNNTYGIQAINKTLYDQALRDWSSPGGCLEQIQTCQALAAIGDPNFIGNNFTVNQACLSAYICEANLVEGAYLNVSNRNFYDIAAPTLDSFPPQYFNGYLSQSSVLGALGVPVNYSGYGNAIGQGFYSIGDYARTDIRGGYLQDLAYLLENNVRVALIYGDRDYACNWIGGENVSLNIPYSSQQQFLAAGYAPIQVNSSYVGGLVRQYGNLSFSRVFESGHEVPSYQPEAALQIFNRAVFGMDIATGNVSIAKNATYATEGPSSSWQTKNQVPPMPQLQCYVLDLYATCTDDQINAVINGSATVKDYILIDNGTANLFPSTTGTAIPTGTGKPAASTIASRAVRVGSRLWWVVGVLVLMVL